MPDKTCILLIDDHALFRGAVARMLSAQPDFEISGEASTVDEGLEIIEAKHVDLVLLDINLGFQQGGAFIEPARNLGYQGKILIVTAGVSRIEAARLRQKGCTDILAKHEPPQLLIERIRHIMRGESLNGAEIATPIAGQAYKADQDAKRPLTPRELQVLRGVFSGWSNKQIAGELGISVSLAKAFVQQLFRKTQVSSRAQLVRVAIERYWQELEDIP